MSTDAAPDRLAVHGEVVAGSSPGRTPSALSSSSSGGAPPGESPATQPSSGAPSTTQKKRWYHYFRFTWRGRSDRPVTISQHHHGNTYNTTNTNTAPVTNIQHATNVSMGAKEDPLEKLPRHPDISDEWADYSEGSRASDIHRIKAWLNDPKAQELILWIYAGSGQGKSTLARQLREEFRLESRSAVAIFLSKLDSKSEDGVVSLVGGEMGRIHRNVARMIVEAIEECHGSPLSLHVVKIILEPLLSLQLPNPFIVIIDSIGEWKSHARFIEQLAPLVPHSSHIRFIVLGRSKPVEGRYRDIPIESKTLDPIPVKVMEKCINARFDDIDWRDERRPPQDAVSGLAVLSAGQFSRMEELLSTIRSLPPSDYDDVSDPLFSSGMTAWNNSRADDSIALLRLALALRPPGHPKRHTSLNYLGAFLWCGHQMSRTTGDLDEAIELHREGLAICGPGHPDRHHPCNNLAGALHSRYQRDGRIEDLEEAIILGREALPLRPPGHPYHFDTVDNQRKYLESRYKKKGNVEDLREAKRMAEEALSASPRDHAHYAGIISSYEVQLAQKAASNGEQDSDQ